MINSDEKILIEAGLSEEQSAIYATLLDKGPLKAASISSWNGIKKGLVYKVLEQLETMGLVSKKGGEGSVAVFSPNSPDRLREIMEQKEKSFSLSKEIILSSVGNLSSKFNLLSGKPNVQFFEGKEGVARVVRDSLNSKTEILTFADNEAMNKYYPELNKENIEARKKSNIKKRLISIDTPYIRELAKNDILGITERRVINSTEKFAVAVQIYDNKVTYITLDPDRAIGVIVEDKAIYEMQKIIFETLWINAKQLTS